MSKLNGKVALVTGASKGIGAAIAQRLAADGASVVVNYASSKEGADKVVAAIASAGGKAVAAQGDVSKAGDAQAIVDSAVKSFGRLDILVNNSGVYDLKPLEQITEDHFHRHFNINVLGLLLVIQAASKHLAEGASIVNIGSVASRLTPPGSAVYTGTKGSCFDITCQVIATSMSLRGMPRAIARSTRTPRAIKARADPSDFISALSSATTKSNAVKFLKSGSSGKKKDP
jgi:3-oxoacyl-[acyl-carrier protein] reductase